MKIIIAGSRTITDYNIVDSAMYEAMCSLHISYEMISEIISGHARGVDRLGEQWAVKNYKKCSLFPADWNRYGKSAGYIRNRKMAEYVGNQKAETGVLIAVWDEKSKGTGMMIDIAKEKGLKVYVHKV